jgi:2-succinyl-6-hydroxy-2,4-cyclohexadiene-1-carboxylate synthase
MRLAHNGISFNVEVWGHGPPLVLLHGFTGSSQTWAPFRLSLGQHFTLFAFDLLGHGKSDASTDLHHYEPDSQVGYLIALFDGLGLTRARLLGYSMGGRIALHLVLAAPERVSALVLESASAGIVDPIERAARRASDDGLAAMIEHDGLEHFVDHWEKLSIFDSQQRLAPALRAELRLQRLNNSMNGLANTLRGAGAGRFESCWSRLPEIDLPALFIAGGLDQKYVEIGRQMTALMSRAELRVVPEAGHAVHLERRDSFTELVGAFLCSTGT